jgi:hypothetical protein
VADTPLPRPDSELLRNLLGTGEARSLYGWLYRRRSNPPSEAEFLLFTGDALGVEADEAHLLMAEVERHFGVARIPSEAGDRLLLESGTNSNMLGAEISARLESQVLFSQRCAQCGKTPTEDRVKLLVDYVIPLSWGGETTLENLQALCERCRDGRRDYLSAHDSDAALIREAMAYPEPQRRIGELLRAFAPREVRSDLIGMVAGAQQFQEDYQRRLRDLRYLGWDYKVRKTGQQGVRIWSYYRLVRSAPWPEDIRAAIREEERRRAAIKQSPRPS